MAHREVLRGGHVANHKVTSKHVTNECNTWLRESTDPRHPVNVDIPDSAYSDAIGAAYFVESTDDGSEGCWSTLDPVRSGETMWDGKYGPDDAPGSLNDDDRWEPGKPMSHWDDLTKANWYLALSNVEKRVGACHRRMNTPALRADDV